MISCFCRAQSADAWLTFSVVSMSPVSACFPGTSSFFMKIGSVMWSEYFCTMVRSAGPESRSSSPSRRWRVTEVPRASRETASRVYSPSPLLSQRTASSDPSPARRVVSVTRPATMKDE